MNVISEMSPCLACTRVQDPDNCENKGCMLWQKWFLARWAILHAYPRYQMDKPRETVGVAVGGNCYAAPHQVRKYLNTDPCRGCSCGEDLCRTPCRARQNWAKAQGKVPQ